MCRLFGMTGGRERVSATFWLLESSDSLRSQSHREPDGTGLGIYDEAGGPVVSKQPLAAYEDREFAREARHVRSRTFIAHIRFATTGAISPQNTHPFLQQGRLFAHNGVIGDLPALERRLGPGRALVAGETDSERYFALITSEIERTGSVSEGIAGAVGWIADELPVYALNFVLITETELWALRYPDVHDLYVLERPPGGSTGDADLDHRDAAGRVRVRSAPLAGLPAVVVATERMDRDPAWRLLNSGELLHVDSALRVSTTTIIDRPPAKPINLADLDPRAASSQTAAT